MGESMIVETGPHIAPSTLASIAAAFAALCLWLTVRIINRRERWAKRMLAAVIAMPVLYVASSGPAVWIFYRLGQPEWAVLPYQYLYNPLHDLSWRFEATGNAFASWCLWWIEL